ncbi:hypothetical protein [Streptomyces cinnamoneus]|uniref:hypothetical protein n=1 Tax=Streptomyces cinnamoneus TaxID=53446 RepID=UPI0015E2AA54|nr:hypothetical protein [Streptomyces cinnamoneus]
MNATQQHMLDLYRAAQHQEPAPPAPGTAERQVVREFRTWRRFQAVVDERAAHRRARWAALFRPFRTTVGAATPEAAAPQAPLRPELRSPARLLADRTPEDCARPAGR